MELLIIFAGAFGVACLFGALTMSVIGRQRSLKDRVNRIGERARPLTAAEKAQKQIAKRAEQVPPVLEAIASKVLPRPSELRARLIRTGRRISLGQYLIASILVSVGVFCAVSIAASYPVSVGVIAAVGAGLGLPHLIVGSMISGRQAKFTSTFPDAIDLMVRGLRSGLPVSETISACGHEMSGPVGEEFRRIADAIRLGQTLEDALWDAARRLDTAEFKFFVISLSVQKETGGNLAETLANLSDILRSRKQMKLKIKAMSSEAKASAFILGSLPFVMFGIIYFINPEYESVLFTDPRGQMMLGAGVGLMALGGFVMAKMVRFEI